MPYHAPKHACVGGPFALLAAFAADARNPMIRTILVCIGLLWAEFALQARSTPPASTSGSLTSVLIWAWSDIFATLNLSYSRAS